MTSVPIPTSADVLAYLGWVSDAALDVQAGTHLTSVIAQVRAYTRGKGFEITGTVPDDVAAVIVSATARSLSNPAQAKRVEAGAFNEVPGSLASFSLLEALVLNAYRRRAG